MSNKPTLIVIAGPNGSGKTSVTAQILKHEWVEGCVYINPDNIANFSMCNRLIFSVMCCDASFELGMKEF